MHPSVGVRALDRVQPAHLAIRSPGARERAGVREAARELVAHEVRVERDDHPRPAEVIERAVRLTERELAAALRSADV